MNRCNLFPPPLNCDRVNVSKNLGKVATLPALTFDYSHGSIIMYVYVLKNSETLMRQ